MISMLLWLWACEDDKAVKHSSTPAPVDKDTLTQKVMLPDIAKPFNGTIIVGGRFCLGDTALDRSLYLLEQPLRNAAINGEGLDGLLERLPYLLAQQPASLMVEIGQEDELARTPLAAFKRNLRRLARLLSGQRWVLLSTAMQPQYRAALTDFAKQQGVSAVNINPNQALARETAESIVVVLAK